MVSFFDFRYALQQWETIGLFDVFLPFLLIFTIIFAILQKTKIFQARKGIDAIVAMALSFIVILNPFVTDIMKVILQNTVIAIMIIVALMLIMGLILGAKKPKHWNFLGLIIGFVFFIWILGRIADYYEMYNAGTMLFSSNWWAINMPWMIPIFIIIIFAIIVISSGSERKEGEKPFGERLMEIMTQKSEEDW
jgi:hypothetical protein